MLAFRSSFSSSKSFISAFIFIVKRVIASFFARYFIYIKFKKETNFYSYLFFSGESGDKSIFTPVFFSMIFSITSSIGLSCG